MPRANFRWIMIVAVLAAISGCTGNGLDDADTGNVVLEVITYTAPPVQGQLTAGACSISANACLSASDCPVGEFCQLNPVTQGCVPQQWSVTLKNVPKNDLATTSPFNDIVLQSLTLEYTWLNGFPTSSAATPLTAGNQLGLTIPAVGQGTFLFTPISQQLLQDLEAFLGTGGSASADVSMTLTGMTVDGEPVSTKAAAALQLANCLRPVGP